MISAKEITSKQFDKATFGYKPEEVDDILREAALTISHPESGKFHPLVDDGKRNVVDFFYNGFASRLCYNID